MMLLHCRNISLLMILMRMGEYGISAFISYVYSNIHKFFLSITEDALYTAILFLLIFAPFIQSGLALLFGLADNLEYIRQNIAFSNT